MLEHTLDKDWIVNREILWQRCQQVNVMPQTHTKREFEAYKDFFFTGDYEKFLKKYKPDYPPFFVEMLELYPASSVKDILAFTNQFWVWCAAENNRNMKDSSEAIGVGFKSVAHYGEFYSDELKVKFFTFLYGDKINPEAKPIDIGVDSINFELAANPVELLTKFSCRLDLVLFHSEDVGSQFVNLLPYFYSLVKEVSLHEIFSVEVIRYRNKYTINRDNIPKMQLQLNFRTLLLNLMGYHDPDYEIVHGFPEIEEQLRNALFNELEMPEVFYELLDYLKEHKQEALSEF